MNDLKFKPDPNGLLKIGKFCESFYEIIQQSRDQPIVLFPLIETLRLTDFSSVFNLSQLIRRVIDIEASKTSEIYIIREHISIELDNLRKKYSNLPEFLVRMISIAILLLNNIDISSFRDCTKNQFKRSRSC